MKKRIIIYITFFSIIQNVFSIEIRTKTIFQGFSTRSTQEIFYTTSDNNLVIKEKNFNTFKYYQIENNNIKEIVKNSYDMKKQEQILYSNELKYSYKVNINGNLIAFDESSYSQIYRNYTPEPLYFYINNSNDQIVFNFNKWKINHEEYFPISTYNSLSEEIFYTDEDRERIMKINTAYTVKNLYCVNNKKNQIAIVLDNYNSEGLSALIIFDVLYNATINDFKVRLRKEPNLDCETLSYFYEGNKVKIVDQSDEPYEIDGENWYWYKVESGSYPVGWVYGKYLDIEK